MPKGRPAITALTEAGYAIVPVSEGNPKCEADCARYWTGVRNKNAKLHDQLAVANDQLRWARAALDSGYRTTRAKQLDWRITDKILAIKAWSLSEGE